MVLHGSTGTHGKWNHQTFFYQVDLINICFHDQSLDQRIKLT